VRGSPSKLDELLFIAQVLRSCRSSGRGSAHLVSLLKAIARSKCAKDTMVIVTYDEFGGQWDRECRA
jgi:hypothetical protein